MKTNIYKPASYLLLGMALVLSFSISVFAQVPDVVTQSEPEAPQEAPAEADTDADVTVDDGETVDEEEDNTAEEPEESDIEPVLDLFRQFLPMAAPEPKIWICHYPEDEEEDVEKLHINANGWSGHENHEHDFIITAEISADPESYECPPLENPEDEPYGVINVPTAGQVVSATTTLDADYFDGDGDNDDAVQWAVREGTCDATGDTVFGNVDGHNDSYTWDGQNFSATLDFSGEDEGDYCFVFNPTDDAGENDVRETVNFVVDHEEEDEHENDAYIVAHKIVCQDESDLPNWGTGGPDIGSTTAADFVADSDGRCWFEEGWEFQWDPLDGVTYADDDFYGPAPTWTSFDGGPTDSNGMTYAWVDVTDGSFWVREVLEEGYIPFTWFWSNENDGDPVSAEMYCGSDVLHYDNLDRVDNPQAGQTYHCVAFNTEIEEEEPDNAANLVIHKVMCEDESDLPNWGNGGNNISSTTAADFVADSDGRCWFEEGWEFEWGPLDVYKPAGDLYGYAGGEWETIAESTDSMGKIDVQFDAENGSFYVREVLQEGYVPFSNDDSHDDPEDNFGAEFYCHTDVLKFDGRDRVDNPQEAETYYCVGFNTEIDDDEEDDNWMCHYPPGNTENVQKINVDDEDVAAHLSHGDVLIVGDHEAFQCPPFDQDPENTPPVITLIGSSTVTVIQNESYVDAGATVNDAEDDPEPALVVGGLPVNTSVLGTTTITYDATDSGSLSAVQITRLVVVVPDDEDPDEHENDAYIVAHKIVCQDESDLPNWGAGAANISSTTAADFVADSDGRCWFEEGWNFEWESLEGAVIATGTHYGPVAGWNTFEGGPTDSNGMTYTWVDQSEGTFWMREVLQDGYIPFSDNNGSFSAEVYCHVDVLNYDNLEYLNDPTAGQAFYCVAFNTEIEDDQDPENTPPVITLVGSSTVTVLQNSVYVDAGATVNDAEDDPEPALVVGGLPVNTSVLGTTTITYDATDSGSLAATQVTRLVVVVPVDEDPQPAPQAEEEEDDDRNGRSGSRRRSGSSGGQVLGATTDSCGMYLLEYLQFGAANNPTEVTKLQSFLNDEGITVPVTGFFDLETFNAVKAFQADLQSQILSPWVTFGYTGQPTGYVYKTTRYTINNIVCPGSEPYPTLP